MDKDKIKKLHCLLREAVLDGDMHIYDMWMNEYMTLSIESNTEGESTPYINIIIDVKDKIK